MSSDTAISVEGLGKRYTLGTQSGERYTALRDVVANSARNLFHRRSAIAPEAANAGDFWALKDVSFEVKQGEVLGIIGRNGAGKSTLLKILSRITEPTNGRIELNGRVASLLEVGTGFHPELTGRENIFLNGAILGMSRVEIKAKFDEIVAFAEVEKFLDTPVKRYSSGMYVRLAFAVAAHLEPEILIVDEVLAVGDAEFQKKCLGKMQDVSRGGRTVLFVSHNIDAVVKLCSSGLFLKRGQVAKRDSIKAVAETYVSDSIAEQGMARDLHDIPRPSYVAGSSFRITNYQPLMEPGRFVFYVGQPIRIRLSYQHKKRVDGLRIGLGINTVYGQRLATFHTPADSMAIESGTGTIEISIDSSTLKPGDYSVDVGARSGKISYDALETVGWLRLAARNAEQRLNDDDNFGLININHQFTTVY